MSDNARIQELLQHMLDSNYSPEEVCAGDPELLPEVRLGWQQLRRVVDQVEALFPTAGAVARAGAATPNPRDKLPDVAGYHVQGVLGHGGMGIVYQARHLKLNRLVALKMLLAGAYAGKQDLARFIREAEAVAALRHSNIVQVYEVGEVEGLPFFTMEFVEGGSLAVKLAGQPQPARQAAELVATLASAVRFAHASGIIHRDLKPSNILLTADGTPKITDFGLARRVEGGPEFTVSGVRVGTPSYMAPEQALGKASAIGLPVDIYALGAILYELLTGRPPFKGETAAETERQVITEEPVPPSRLNARVPRDLETICLKCLHKVPARRYAAAQDLAEDLRCFVEGRPIRARPVGAAERALKWARRRPAAALLLAALLVIVGAATGAALWLRQQQAAQAQREGQARDAIEAALRRVGELQRDERWREARLVLTEAWAHVVEAGSPLLEERLQQAQADLRIATEVDRVRESCPFNANGIIDYRQRAADYQKAFKRAGLPIGEAESVVAHVQGSAIRDQFLAALDDWALMAFLLHDGPLVERLLRIARSADPEPRWRDRFRHLAVWRSREQLLRLAADAFNTSPPPPTYQLGLLGLLLGQAGAWTEGLHLLGEAWRRQPGNFWVNRDMAFAHRRQNRLSESIAYYRAAVALRPDSGGAHLGLGWALFMTGQVDESFAVCRRAVELLPTSNTARVHLVGVLAASGYWKEAEAECRRASEIDPPRHLPFLRLAFLLGEHQRDEDAVVMYRKAIKIDPNALEAHYSLGLHFMRTARHEEAVRAFRKVTELTPAYRFVHQMLAHELAAVGRRVEAIAVLRTAVARDPTNAQLHQELGTLLRKQGRPEEAVAAFRMAVKLASRRTRRLPLAYASPAHDFSGRTFPRTSNRGAASNLQPRPTLAEEGLAAALLDHSGFAEARALTERLPALAVERRAQRRQLNLCDTLLAVEAKLPAILAGKERPTEVATLCAVAEWCLEHKRLTATAAGFYTRAFSAQPSLAADLEAGHRFHAARAAALAGCGVGEETAQLDGRRRCCASRHSTG
jgi:serine/threonine-protein kinase